MNEKMNKQEFLKELKVELGLPNIDEAGRILDGVNALITKKVLEGTEVNFVGFGKYGVAEKGARTMKHPQSTAENPLPDINVPAGHKPTFKFSDKIKDQLKG